MEYRLYVKFVKRRTAFHYGSVDSAEGWMNGKGPKFIMESSFLGGVDNVALYEYTDGKRGKLLFYRARVEDSDETKGRDS